MAIHIDSICLHESIPITRCLTCKSGANMVKGQLTVSLLPTSCASALYSPQLLAFAHKYHYRIAAVMPGTGQDGTEAFKVKTKRGSAAGQRGFGPNKGQRCGNKGRAQKRSDDSSWRDRQKIRGAMAHPPPSPTPTHTQRPTLTLRSNFRTEGIFGSGRHFWGLLKTILTKMCPKGGVWAPA